MGPTLTGLVDPVSAEIFFVSHINTKKKIPLLRLGSVRGQLSAKANAIPPHIHPDHR